jgi:hypothetical protein
MAHQPELVFVGGAWRQIQMPIDTRWTLEYRQLFACAVVGFERQGFCEADALRLAECLVYKLLHKGLVYDKKTESFIADLWGIA